MKTFFILDDDYNRVMQFRRAFNTQDYDYEIVHAVSVEKAKELYPTKEYDAIFLDHDLGGKVYVDSEDENTGYQFAKWLKENVVDIDNYQIFLHTMNTVGAENMQKILPKAIPLPFPLLLKCIKGEA